jgi:lysine 6-dehydrogenase
MKVVVVGGAGEVGMAGSRELPQCRDVDHLVIADVDEERAGLLAAELAGARSAVSAVGLDVRDSPHALTVLEGADLLMNCLRFALFDHAIELASEAGVDYADLISEPTAAHHLAAERAGITAVSGLGATPGLSNVLVRHAAEELDELEEAHISWVSFRTIAPTPGALNTILWELSEDCPTRQYFQDAQYLSAGFMEGCREVEFAAPVGRQRVYFVPHTEVRTLPRHFPSLRFCAVRGSWRPELMDDIRVLNRYGLLEGGALETTRDRIWERVGGERDNAFWPLFLKLEVVGAVNGNTLRRVYDVSHPVEWGPQGMARMTGTCAAVGAQLLARHGRRGAGFIDPEVYYDPREFLRELALRESVDVKWTDEPLGSIHRPIGDVVTPPTT